MQDLEAMPVGGKSRSITAARERTPEQYVRLFYRSRWAMIIIFCAVVTSSIVFSFIMRPVYEAKSVVIIEPRAGKQGLSSVLDVSGYIQPGAFNVSVINNQVEILKSYSLAERTVELFRNTNNAERMELFRSDNGAPSQNHLVRRLRGMTDIVPLNETDIIEIRVRTGSSWEAAVIANGVAEAYIEETMYTAREEVRDVKAFLQEQLSTVRGRLAEAEDHLKAYQEKEKVASLSDETASLVERLAYFEGLYNEAQVDLQTAQRRLRALREQLAEQQGSLVDQVAQVSSPVIAKLRGEIASLEAIRSKYLAQGYDEKHEKMLEIEKRIDDTRARLLATAKEVAGHDLASADPLAFSHKLVDEILALQVDVEAMVSRASSLKDIAAAYEIQLEQLPERSLQLARLKRAAKVDENILTMLMEKYEESRLREAGETGSVRIIDRAREPERPIRPQKRLNVIAGCVLGLFLSLGFTLVRDHFQRTIVDIEEMETLAGVPVLGWIPAIRNRHGRKRHGRRFSRVTRVVDPAAEVELRLLVHLEPRSPASESYRTLRTNIRFLGVDEPVKSIVITSPGASEGKSTTVANLAISMAQGGARTLLVDSDLRRPTLDTVFEIRGGCGLTEILTGTRSIKECILSTKVENLDIIGSGTLPPNPSEMLGSERMKEVIRSLSESYEYILLDSPPVLPVTDAVVLGAVADLTVLVVRSGRTKWANLARAVNLLKNVRAKQVGTVLNAVQIEGSYSRYHDYYGYYEQLSGTK